MATRAERSKTRQTETVFFLYSAAESAGGPGVCVSVRVSVSVSPVHHQRRVSEVRCVKTRVQGVGVIVLCCLLPPGAESEAVQSWVRRDEGGGR